MKKLFTTLSCLLLVACGNIDIEQYRDNKPRFDPNVFFNGSIKAEGVVLSRSGEQLRYFTADINASWNEKQGHLNEVFYWSDGEKQLRDWTFKAGKNGVWIGTAADVDGQAEMYFAGNAIHMRYQLDVPVDGKTITLTMDDWLYQVSDKVIINKTRMSKFGFRVGEVILTMRKL